MRSFVVLCLLATVAQAKPVKRESHHVNKKVSRSARIHMPQQKATPRVRAAYVIRGEVEGQSLGQPWQGKLHEASELPAGDGYVIRRPSRAFGTKTTVEFIHHAVVDMREQFPDTHVLAIGDISQESGGQITQHRSHQSGRDVDIGLVYKDKPADFPENFVAANANNLDCEATYALLNEFAETAHEDGGAQVIFLDYNVQGLLYHWAKDHGEDETVLAQLFQFPNRSSSSSIVRHIANHDNHMHVRFKCPAGDTSCSN